MFNFLSNVRFQTITLILLIILFWFPICFNNEFFYDDWSSINAFKEGVGISYFLKPSNEHFAPIAKFIVFAMFKLFYPNIVPYMIVSILFHIFNSILFFFLLRLIFKKHRFLPILLAMFFALNTTYFEILHWFACINFTLTFSFLLGTLFCMHKSVIENNKKLYWLSAVLSFFIPLNSFQGFLSIIFVPLYYFLVIKGGVSIDEIKKGLRFLLPFLAIWVSSFVFYLFFSLVSVLNQPSTAPKATFDIGNLMVYVLLGFSGLFVKNIGFSVLVFPYTTGSAILLGFLAIFFGMLMLFYLVLNKWKERVPLFKNKASLYGLFCMFICYLVLAFGRASLGGEAFLSWGRYHYLPMFFFTILLGAIMPQIIETFSKIFNPRKFKAFLFIVFLVFLATHFVLIRQKSESGFRTEGALPQTINILCG